MTIDFAPWPIGTSVGLYDKKSELMMPDMAPPETDLLALSTVDAAGGVFFPAVAVGDYWAIGQIDGVYRYVQIVVSQDDELTERVSVAEAQIAALDGRLDVVEPKAETNRLNIANLDAEMTAVLSRLSAIEGDWPDAVLNERTGVLAPSNRGWGAMQINPSSQRIHVMRFVAPKQLTVTQIRFFVEAAGADVAVDVGIYDATFSKVVTSGALTGKLNSTLIKSMPIASTILQPGVVYYAAFATNTGNSASVTGVTASGVHQLHMNGDVLSQQGPWPLPASLAPTALAGIPGIALVVAP